MLINVKIYSLSSFLKFLVFVSMYLWVSACESDSMSMCGSVYVEVREQLWVSVFIITWDRVLCSTLWIAV